MGKYYFMNGKIIGLGGIFIRSKDKTKLMNWYRDVMNINIEDWGSVFSLNDIANNENQVFSIFPSDTSYFPSSQSYMINWMIDDLDSFLLNLKLKNIEVLKQEVSEYGKFAWIHDIEGNKLELWEPPKTNQTK